MHLGRQTSRIMAGLSFPRMRESSVPSELDPSLRRDDVSAGPAQCLHALCSAFNMHNTL
jgi:hypothetical protein